MLTLPPHFCPSRGREGFHRPERYRRNPAWEAGISLAIASGAGRTRTPDFWFWRPAFYQLNYCPGWLHSRSAQKADSGIRRNMRSVSGPVSRDQVTANGMSNAVGAHLCEQRVHDDRVELRAGAAAHLIDRLSGG